MTSQELPKSSALAEASPDSLSELLSKDPEMISEEDEQKIIAALRAQRERWQLAEKGKEGRVTMREKAEKARAILQSPASIDDLGL